MLRRHRAFSFGAQIANGASRVHNGVHGSFDDIQGQALGENIANWIIGQVDAFSPANQPYAVLQRLLAGRPHGINARWYIRPNIARVAGWEGRSDATAA